MPEITIYTRKFCGFCTAAKALLTSKNANFTELDGTYDQSVRTEMIQKSNGGRTFPQIFIGDVHVGGSDDLAALEREGKLDALLSG